MFGVLVPVGPDPRDVSRLAELLSEIDRHEDRDGLRLILVDDSHRPRSLAAAWPDRVIVRTALWDARRPPDRFSAHVAGTLDGLRAARDLEFVVKLDTDAAVIRPFSATIRDVLRDDRLGVIGSYDVAFDGGRRDWSVWKHTIDRATWRVAVNRSGMSIALGLRPNAHRVTIRRVRDAAYRVAPPGAHCLGGAYAVSKAFLESVSLDWRPWVRTSLGEDVLIGLLASHAGLAMKSLTGTGEPFAVSWRGLPASPDEIAHRGHSIVHSVKREREGDELALRAALQGAPRAAGSRL